MIFLRSRVLGFGKLRGISLSFGNRLNVVFAGNEGGKSTLQRFLVGLLYGQLRADLRIQRRLDPWVEQYKPWYGSEYGGILWCQLADGKELEIHRYFGKDDSRIEIRSAAGEDITRQYEQQRNGEVLFARFHLGIPKELFESVAMIIENRVAEIQSRENIRDRIANLAQSGDEELSVRQSIEKIQEALDSIGSERAPTKPYRQALDLVQALRDEQRALEERRAQFQNWIEERNRIAEEISMRERELSIARANLFEVRRRELTEKILSLEEIEKNMRSLRQEIEFLGARADFPADRLEELDQLVGARESLARHLSQVRSEKEEALAQLARAELERQELAAYGTIAVSPEAERITEWFVTYLSLSLQRDGLQKTLTRLQGECDSLQASLLRVPQAMTDPGIDWQRLAREAAEEEQIASQNCAALAEKIALEKSAFSSAKRAARNRRVAAIASVIPATAPFVTRIFPEFAVAPEVEIAFATVFVLLAVILLYSSAKCAKASRNAKQMLQALEVEQSNLREEGSKKRRKLNQAVTDSGFTSLDEFLEAAKEIEQKRQKLSELQTRCDEAKSQREQLKTQIDETYGNLKESLARVGLPCSPGNLKFQIDTLRNNLRRYRELNANYNSWAQRTSALESRDRELTEEYREVCHRVKSLLAEAQVDTPEHFREECRKRQRLLDLRERESSRAREFYRLAGELTLPQWKSRLQELMEQEAAQGGEYGQVMLSKVGSDDTSVPYLPYLPTAAEIEEEVNQITSHLFKAREEHARLVERIRQAFNSFRTSSEIEEDLAIAERKCREMEMNRLALNTALEIIENLSRQQQEVLAPQLNAAVEQRFLRLCERRYEEVKIDPDFQVWVRELSSGQLRAAEQLSRGTQDQLYFAVRFGILDLISNEDEPCPCLLDEPFAAYDRTRLAEAFRVLEEESLRRQLILFTCREDLLALAGQHGANVIFLP